MSQSSILHIGICTSFGPSTMLFLLLWLCSNNMKLDMVIPSPLLFLFRVILATLGVLCFHINFEIPVSMSAKKDPSTVKGAMLNLCTAFVGQPFS